MTFFFSRVNLAFWPPATSNPGQKSLYTPFKFSYSKLIGKRIIYIYRAQQFDPIAELKGRHFVEEDSGDGTDVPGQRGDIYIEPSSDHRRRSRA